AGKNALSATVRTINLLRARTRQRATRINVLHAASHRHHKRSGWSPAARPTAIWPASRCYVPRALGESGTRAGSRGLRGATVAAAAVVGALALGLAACGGGERQDATEASGEFTVEVPKASFPSDQQLANS